MAPVAAEEDYYAVLEIPLTATEGEVRQAYQRLAKLRHPDKNLGKATATAAFQLVSVSLLTFPFQRIKRAC